MEDTVRHRFRVATRSAKRRKELGETTIWECLGDYLFAYWNMVDDFVDDILGVNIGNKSAAMEINLKKAGEGVAYAKKRWGRCNEEQAEASIAGFLSQHTPATAETAARKIADAVAEEL